MNGTVKLVEHYAGAKVHKAAGVLEIIDCDEELHPALVPNLGKFHTSDTRLFYESIQQNIKIRIDAYYDYNPVFYK